MKNVSIKVIQKKYSCIYIFYNLLIMRYLSLFEIFILFIVGYGEFRA